jgi:hypothetical protein
MAAKRKANAPTEISDGRLVQGSIEHVLESIDEGRFEHARAALQAARARLERYRPNLGVTQLEELEHLLRRAEAALVRRLTELQS